MTYVLQGMVAPASNSVAQQGDSMLDRPLLPDDNDGGMRVSKEIVE